MAALDLEYGNFSLAMAARGAQIKAAQVSFFLSLLMKYLEDKLFF